jgi:hypothetical protein
MFFAAIIWVSFWGFIDGRVLNRSVHSVQERNRLGDALSLLQLTSQLQSRGHGRLDKPSPDGISEALSLLQTGTFAPHGKHALSLFRQLTLRGADVIYPNLSISSMEMPWEAGIAPLASCEDAKANIVVDDANAHLFRAVNRFCDADLGGQVEFFVDPRFKNTYDNFSGVDGWIPEAFLTYTGIEGLDNTTRFRISNEVDLLVQSVHHFSTRPVIVTNFGRDVPVEWTPERFPQMVLMHARKIRGYGGKKSFNFNKLRGMLFTKVSVGLVLDADQWINSGVDHMFRRALDEGGSDYPFPIQPVHWMSRDPESRDMEQYPEWYTFRWQPQEEVLGAPVRTMRWGHAHPSWTHHALDFLAKWTASALSDQNDYSSKNPDTPEWLRYHMNITLLEDEDLLNFALWAEGQRKMWCKFDIPFVSVFDGYLDQKIQRLYADSKWFPTGIPLVFTTAHDAKTPPESFEKLQRLWNITDQRPSILYDGRWFNSGEDLRAFDPDLKCII